MNTTTGLWIFTQDELCYRFKIRVNLIGLPTEVTGHQLVEEMHSYHEELSWHPRDISYSRGEKIKEDRVEINRYFKTLPVMINYCDSLVTLIHQLIETHEWKEARVEVTTVRVDACVDEM